MKVSHDRRRWLLTAAAIWSIAAGLYAAFAPSGVATLSSGEPVSTMSLWDAQRGEGAGLALLLIPTVIALAALWFAGYRAARWVAVLAYAAAVAISIASLGIYFLLGLILLLLGAVASAPDQRGPRNAESTSLP